MKCCGLSPFRLAQETSCFALATLLSCGPSQLFGVVKLLLDGYLYWSVRSQVQAIAAARVSLQTNWQDFKGSPLANLIAQKLLCSVDELSSENAQKYVDSKERKRTAKIARLYHSLKADLCALIPFLGAHISWRVATNYKGFSFTPILSKGVQQLFESHPKIASLPLFFGRMTRLESAQTLMLEVTTSTKKRSIQYILDTPFGSSEHSKKIVVLFHGNIATGMRMHTEVAPFYRERGYSTLSFTMGGYGDSKGVKTSEKSFYQDIEAIKQFLQRKGFEEVGYHGLSLGSSGAIHAASYESEQTNKLKTLFVVADQPFTSAFDVAGNVAGPLGVGLFQAGLPAGTEVELPGGETIETNGLDNARKIAKLKEKNIPLVCIQATKDILMGRRGYTENFAKDLLAKRYDTFSEEQDHLITINGPHNTRFIVVNASGTLDLKDLPQERLAIALGLMEKTTTEESLS